MASERATTAALTLLSRAFAGEVDAERIAVYVAALEDLTDAEVAAAAALLVKTHVGEFIPPPAVIRRAVLGDETPRLDIDRIIREIGQMGSYGPNGWCDASVETVRRQAGSPIAGAYADVGGSRLFSNDPRTRDIAAQEFRRVLGSETAAGYTAFPPWAIANPPRLAAGETKQLGPGPAR
jgi:hypothetical protein